MTNSNNQKPVVLVLAGHDPCGGAGIQADIESISNAGAFPTTVITSLTSQNTKCVSEFIPQKASTIKEQIRLLIDDMEIAACKIGMIGDASLIEPIHSELSRLNIPIILDPVLASSTGQTFADDKLREELQKKIFPLLTLVSPNSEEAKLLSTETNLASSAEKLLDFGADSVLITGTHEKTENVINTFYKKTDPPIEFRWERLPGNYHGSGCTLSSRIAANLALGKTVKSAVEEAQAYTWRTLKNGLQLGKEQKHPNRFFDQKISGN